MRNSKPKYTADFTFFVKQCKILTLLYYGIAPAYYKKGAAENRAPLKFAKRQTLLRNRAHSYKIKKNSVKNIPAPLFRAVPFDRVLSFLFDFLIYLFISNSWTGTQQPVLSESDRSRPASSVYSQIKPH